MGEYAIAPNKGGSRNNKIAAQTDKTVCQYATNKELPQGQTKPVHEYITTIHQIQLNISVVKYI